MNIRKSLYAPKIIEPNKINAISTFKRAKRRRVIKEAIELTQSKTRFPSGRLCSMGWTIRASPLGVILGLVIAREGTEQRWIRRFARAITRFEGMSDRLYARQRARINFWPLPPTECR
jgi:hypothetical protein